MSNMKFAFDLEGTLVDLEGLHQQAFERVARDLGVAFGNQQFRQFVGAGDQAISNEIAKLVEGSQISAETIKAAKQAVYRDLLYSE